MLVGIISDTHGLLRPEAVAALRGCELIIHAGDIGDPKILGELEKIGPVRAIRGNIDVQPWAREVPDTDVVEAGGLSIYVLHNLKGLDLNPRTAGFAAVISGHSHKPLIEMRDGILHFNPGSAGPRRFSLPITIGRLRVRKGKLEPEVIDLQLPK